MNQTWWPYTFAGSTRNANAEIKSLFDGARPFDTPKPSKLIQRLIELGCDSDSIVVDFFAGSATTADAVMTQNTLDHGQRKFILVQLPELTPSESEARKFNLDTIADIAKERLRKSGQRIRDTKSLTSLNLDLGFRVLKIDSSNMKDVYYSPQDTSQELLAGLVDNIKPDRTGEDLLFQVMLDCGVDLGLPIKSEKLDGCEVLTVADSEVISPALITCFDPEVPESLVKTLAHRKALRAVFRDHCFTADADKIDVEQIFKQLSPETQLRSL